MSKRNWDHPLSDRHFKQIVCRNSHHREKMYPVWAITWRPGGNTGSFLGNLFRPLGSATMMVQVSYPRKTNREGIALFGIGARIDPQQAIVFYDDLRLRHDFHRVPFVGALGAILDPSDEKRGTCGNGSWVQLALEVDRLRNRAATKHFRLPVVPQLPQIFYGYGRQESAKYEVTSALRYRAAASMEVEWNGSSLHDLGRFEAASAHLREQKFELLAAETQQELLRTAWEAAFIPPTDPGNTTGLWLLPHEMSRDVYPVARIYEHFGDFVGANILNPACRLGRLVPNPAVDVATQAGVDLIADLAMLAPTGEGSPELTGLEERLLSLLPGYRTRLSASEEISDQDLLHALCQPDQPVAIAPPLADLAESEQISQMRAALRPHVSACCTDANLLAAAQNPHTPLFASGLCQVQTLFRHRRVQLEDALCFTSRRLERERIEAQFWHSQWCDSQRSGNPMPPVEMIVA